MSELNLPPTVPSAGSSPGLSGLGLSARRRRWRVYARNRTAVLGAAILVVLIVVAVFAPWIAPHDPLAQSVQSRLEGPSWAHPFGLDHYGRDVMSRVIYGARVSLLVGVASIAFAAVIGVALGIAAGFLRGPFEAVVMRVMDMLLAFPNLILGLLVLSVIGPGLRNMIIAVGIAFVPNFARLAHGPTLSIREKEYVQSAIGVGAGDLRIMWKHVAPNLRSDLIVVGTLYIAAAILIEANLSFIGLGASPPTPTWGQTIRDGMAFLADSPWYSLTPGIAIFLAVAGFNLIGDGLRDALDPRSAGR